MKEYEKELDVVAVHLTNAADLLLCFLDFCDNEGNTAGCKTSDDVKVVMTCFFQRMDMHKALIESALFTVRHECEIIQSIFDEQEAAT